RAAGRVERPRGCTVCLAPGPTRRRWRWTRRAGRATTPACRSRCGDLRRSPAATVRRRCWGPSAPASRWPAQAVAEGDEGLAGTVEPPVGPGWFTGERDTCVLADVGGETHQRVGTSAGRPLKGARPVVDEPSDRSRRVLVEP